MVPLIAYIETLLEAWFATYTNLPEGSTAMDSGFVPAAIVPVDVRSPVAALMAYIEMLLDDSFAT